MNTGDNLTSYRDFEQIMVRLASERNWSFEFAGEPIPSQAVFNPAAYAPALLTAANAELAARGIPLDLGIELCGESNSLFGARVAFSESGKTIQAQMMRIGTTALIIESLPKPGNAIQLDPLQFMLGEEFAHNAAQVNEADQ